MAMHAWRLGVLADHMWSSRAARGRRTAETRRPPGGAQRQRRRGRGRDDDRGQAGVDDDGGAGAAETTRSIVDRKVEDEPVDIYRPGPFSPGW